MSCKKIYNYEFTATLEEEFDDVEKATNQMSASDKCVVKEISNIRLINAIIKREDDDK